MKDKNKIIKEDVQNEKQDQEKDCAVFKRRVMRGCMRNDHSAIVAYCLCCGYGKEPSAHGRRYFRCPGKQCVFW